MRSALFLILTCFGFAFPAQSRADGACRETLIKITTIQDGDRTDFYVQNLQSAEVTVTFEMDLQNLKGTESFPHTCSLEGKQRVKVFSLAPGNPEETWNWGYTYYSTFGTPQANHDSRAVYTLPFAPGAAYKVTQSFNGKYSHFGANQYAIDWKMAPGTPIHAARGGVVAGVKNDSEVGGPEDKFDSDANYILIRHADGTYGHYVHLAHDGARVKVGDTVERGQFIGLSGNTGHSTGPHLHFSVFKARNGKERETIPVKFLTAQGLVDLPERGKSYRAADRNELLAYEQRQRPIGALGVISY